MQIKALFTRGCEQEFPSLDCNILFGKNLRKNTLFFTDFELYSDPIFASTFLFKGGMLEFTSD